MNISLKYGNLGSFTGDPLKYVMASRISDRGYKFGPVRVRVFVCQRPHGWTVWLCGGMYPHHLSDELSSKVKFEGSQAEKHDFLPRDSGPMVQHYAYP